MRTKMRLNGISAEVGTLLGPDWSGMILVVESVDATGVNLRGARSSDFAAVPEARSLIEHRMMERQGQGWVAALMAHLRQPKVHEGTAFMPAKLIAGRGMNG